MSFQDYIDEFYKLSIRVEHGETEEQMIARYINGLKISIQDELSMLIINNIKDTYQFTLKVEEKQDRKLVKNSFVVKKELLTPFNGYNGFNYSSGELFKQIERQTMT